MPDALGVLVGAPGAVGAGAGAVETRQVRELEEQTTGARHAVLGLGVGHVRDDRVVGVGDVAVAVGRGGVHPRHAAGGVLATQQVADVGRLAHLEEGVDRAQLLGVGIPDRPHALRGPRHEQRRGVDDVALGRAVEVLGHGAERAVGVLDLDLHRAVVQVVRPVLTEVRREAGQPVLVRREAVGGRDGVAPGDVLVPADVDDRGTDQRGTGDVVLAGNRELLLGEVVATAPREVRVAEQHALAGGRGVAADRGGVRAER